MPSLRRLTCCLLLLISLICFRNRLHALLLKRAWPVWLEPSRAPETTSPAGRPRHLLLLLLRRELVGERRRERESGVSGYTLRLKNLNHTAQQRHSGVCMWGCCSKEGGERRRKSSILNWLSTVPIVETDRLSCSTLSSRRRVTVPHLLFFYTQRNKRRNGNNKPQLWWWWWYVNIFRSDLLSFLIV